LTYLGRSFGLSDVLGTGISCSRDGVFVGGVPLLERNCSFGTSGHDGWQPRPLSDFNRDLSARYGLPIEFDRKIGGLRIISQALDRGDLIYAQIATLHLEIPEPPSLGISARSPDRLINLARQLAASRLLKADWDPAKHPRWPAGSPGGIGGEFAPAGATLDDTNTSGSDDEAPIASITPAQLTIPAPFDFPIPPLPSEVLPPPAIPDIYPRGLPQNPYPDRPECAEQWANAIAYCNKLLESGRLGTDEYRGKGRTFQQCVLGLVTEDCGGSPVERSDLLDEEGNA